MSGQLAINRRCAHCTRDEASERCVLAEEVVVGRCFFGGWGCAEDVGDADACGVGVAAEAAAVVAGEGGVGVEGEVEGVGEAVVFGDVVAFDDGGFAAA